MWVSESFTICEGYPLLGHFYQIQMHVNPHFHTYKNVLREVACSLAFSTEFANTALALSVPLLNAEKNAVSQWKHCQKLDWHKPPHIAVFYIIFMVRWVHSL